MVTNAEGTGVPSMKKAWQDATDALLLARATGRDEDKVVLTEKLYAIAVAHALRHIRKHVDQFLPLHARRDPKVLAHEVVSSIMVKGGRATRLLKTFDEDKGSLAALYARCIQRKVLDRMRKEPVPGVIGRPKKGATKSSAPPAVDVWGAERSLLTLPPAGPLPRAAGFAADADCDGGIGASETFEIIEQLDALLDPSEREVLYYVMAGHSNDQAIEEMNAEHAPRKDTFGKEHPYMTEKKHRMRLESARRKFLEVFQEFRAGPPARSR